ncbi:hypothetical protein [Gordonia sputi]
MKTAPLRTSAIRRIMLALLAGIAALLATAGVASTAHADTDGRYPSLPMRGVDGGPGLVRGSNFSPSDRPYVISDDFAGIEYTFGIPDDWSCGAGSSAVSANGKATCFQEDTTKTSAAGGVVAYQKCAATRCTTADVKGVTSQVRVDSESWRAVDDTTWYAEQSGSIKGVRKVRVAVAHVFHTADGEAGIAFAQLDGPPSKRGELLKIINSIRANTPR